MSDTLNELQGWLSDISAQRSAGFEKGVGSYTFLKTWAPLSDRAAHKRAVAALLEAVPAGYTSLFCMTKNDGPDVFIGCNVWSP